MQQVRRAGGAGGDVFFHKKGSVMTQTRAGADAVCLREIAHARSGDKGNHANVAVIAYTEAGFHWLRGELTAERVAAYFQPLGPSRVERFEAANLFAFNFLLYDVLAGGASRSMRIDTQGKALGTAILQLRLPKPPGLEAMLRPRKAADQ